jgi:hypothetical protein
MRSRDTLALDEAEVLAGRYKSVSRRYYVLHDPQKLTDKYIIAWSNFGVNIPHIQFNMHICIYIDDCQTVINKRLLNRFDF